MKHLSQMTRDELLALDESEIEQLWESNKYRVKRLTIIETVEDVRNCLDQLRADLTACGVPRTLNEYPGGK